MQGLAQDKWPSERCWHCFKLWLIAGLPPNLLVFQANVTNMSFHALRGNLQCSCNILDR